MCPAEALTGEQSVIARCLAEMAGTADLIAGLSDLNEILQRLASRARDLAGASYAAVSTFDEEGAVERFVYTGMDEAQARRLGNGPTGRGLLGELARQEHTMVLDDLRAHPSFTGWPDGHPAMCRFIGAPIRAGGRTIGAFFLARGEAEEAFSSADELSIATLAQQAAVSVATALAQDRSGRLFLLEERERIAHDLHDGTIQALYALGLELDALSNRADVPPVTREPLTHGVARINDLIGDIRAYITMLEAEAPAAQPELGRDLAFVLRQMVPSGTDTVVNITAAALQELSARESEDLLYIAREAISNAIRHGEATKIAVDLRQTPGETALTIQDNGAGFDSEHVRTGLGSVTMRTRAERLGGTLTVLGIPGMGTTVRVAIPRRRDD